MTNFIELPDALIIIIIALVVLFGALFLVGKFTTVFSISKDIERED